MKLAIKPTHFSTALLILIFPVSFIWTLGGVYGLVDANSLINSFVLKGPLGLILLGYYLVSQYRKIIGKVFVREQLLFWLMVAIMLLVICSHYLWSEVAAAAKQELFGFNIKIWIRYVSMFLIGYFAPTLASRLFYKGAVAVWCLLLLTVLSVVRWSSFSLSLQDAAHPSLWSHYLFWGDCFAIVSLFVIGQARQWWVRFSLFAVSAAILYALQSRGAFFAFLLAYPAFLLWRRDYRVLITLSICGVLAVLVVLGSGDRLGLGSRFTTLLVNPKADQSYLLRSEMLEHGLTGIKNHPVLGDYGGQLTFERQEDGEVVRGAIGSYIHNYLSLWRQFGIIVFGIFLFYAWKLGATVLKRRREQDFSDAGVWAAFLFVFIALLTSRSYFVPYFWFFVGYLEEYLVMTTSRQPTHQER